MITAHTDVVGSLLRPVALRRARDDLVAGRLSHAQFKSIEDRAVDEAVSLQEAAGLDIVTDGEMRRLSFQSPMTEAVDGFGPWDIDAFLWGHWHGDGAVGERRRDRPINLGVVGRLVRKRHLAAEEFVYLRGRTSRVAKVTLPSPGLFVNFWSPERSQSAYASLEHFLADVVAILRDEVAELIRLGATYIQIDAPHYPLLLARETRSFYESRGWTLDQWLSRGIGLVSTKRPQTEAPEDLIRRITEASRFVPLERLALSPQCGFASSIVGNNLSIEDERRKLETVFETARRIWG